MRDVRWKRLLAPTLALLLGAAAGGCARTQAAVAVEPTPLDVPPPPPRLVEPVVSADAPPPPPVDAEQADHIVTTRPEPPAPKPEPVHSASEKPAEPAQPASPSPSTTLQTLPVEREQQVWRSVRANLDGAIANLNRVDYQLLGPDARVTFDQARRFIAQAEEALRARNFVFAATVADKAATLAAQLAHR